MSTPPRITLEQWHALVAVVDAGGYARAAEAVHKSQSTLTYAIQKIESLLGVKAFEMVGRRAVLTPTGRLLYHRARALVDEAGGLERSARALSAGWEAEIRLAVEIIFPTWLVLRCLDRLGAESPHTRVELIESVLRGTPEALTEGRADLGIASVVPEGMPGDPLMSVRFVAAAHPDHPLHHLGRPLTYRDLRGHRHLVVRDTASRRDQDKVTVGATSRWTVSNMATSIEAACLGMGFAWFPEERIRNELRDGRLAPLPLREGAQRQVTLHLIVADPEMAGPGTLRLAQILREAVSRECTGADAQDRRPRRDAARRALPAIASAAPAGTPAVDEVTALGASAATVAGAAEAPGSGPAEPAPARSTDSPTTPLAGPTARRAPRRRATGSSPRTR